MIITFYMKLSLHPKIVYRIPRFSIHSSLEETWPELQFAIAHSSHEFYQLIKDVQAHEVNSLPKDIRETIWKYSNRSKFRATPFGRFAGLGVADLEDNKNGDLKITNEPLFHTFLDWTFKDQVEISLPILLQQNGCLFTNSTYYLIGDQIRYIMLNDAQFQLAEIEMRPDILRILEYCKKPIHINNLINQHSNFIDQDNALELVSYLIDNQLLITSLHPNIIGEDYFKRVQFPLQSKIKEYIITERPKFNGAPNPKHFRHVPALVDKLKSLVPLPEHKSLERFKMMFQKKFEHRAVPIMIAIDPELGVGFNDMENVMDDDFSEKIKPLEKSVDPFDDLKRQLLSKMLNSFANNDQFMDIEKIDTGLSSQTFSIANTTSMICSVVDDQLNIESFGGNSANSMLGRFSLAIDDVLGLCHDLASIEESANPDVHFFDIGYMAEGYVDNINRRQSIYGLQLNLLGYDTTKDPLTLDDLFISVRAGELYLHSKRLNRRLIPRVASAYNHQRSDLPVFRLLWELQNQNLHTDLNFSINKLIPGLDYYPEVRFRNICLSPRCWKIMMQPDFIQIKVLNDWLIEKGVPQFFRTGKGDQTLTFNRDKVEDLNVLINLISAQQSLMLSEVKFPQSNALSDEDNLPYLSQFLISLVHHDQIYKGSKLSYTIEPKSENNIEALGGNWLYFEIFCHPSRADFLLTQKISKYLNIHTAKIQKWFFIRYNEEGPHFRLRIHLRNHLDSQLLVASLTKSLKIELRSGIISDIRLRNYTKETERYGFAGIHKVESHFWLDSRYVLRILDLNISTMEKYKLSYQLLSFVRTSGIFEEVDFIQLVEHLASSFNKEHQFGIVEFKELNKQYRKFRELPFMAPDPLSYGVKRFADSIIQLLQNCPTGRRAQLFADVFHMHINRLFGSNQRIHEAIVYYFTSKELLRDLNMSKLQRA
jgi:thiopeptide-type bacteriocin biosynthesis protein